MLCNNSTRIVFIALLILPIIYFYAKINSNFIPQMFLMSISTLNHTENSSINTDTRKYEKEESIQKLFKKQYSLNNNFMINNNIAQYSSYIIIDKDKSKNTICTIETFIQLDHRYLNNYGEKENFKCLLKIVENVNNSIVEEEVIELEVSESPKFNWNFNKKLIFNFNLEKSITYSIDSVNFDFSKILVAVIWKKGFNKELNLNSFNDKAEKIWSEFAVLPYELIKYQIPTIIKINQPRLPSVGLCAHYVYKLPRYLLSWIDIHLSVGVNGIRIYDGTIENDIQKTIESKYGNDKRISVMPCKIGFNHICSEEVLFKQFNTSIIPKAFKDHLKNTCNNFFISTFTDPVQFRWRFEQITGNDCFSILSKKHEFIAYCDLDEVFRPRSLDFYDKNIFELTNGNSLKTTCPLNPMKTNQENALYNYVTYLIEIYRGGRNLENFSSMRFMHSLYLVPSDGEKKFISDLGDFIEQFDNGKVVNFPFSLQLKNPTLAKYRMIIIEKENMDYVRYLYKSYNNYVSTISDYFLKNITNIDENLIRYFYYMENDKENTKEIHYYKNVKSVYHHHSEEVEKGSWMFIVNNSKGEFFAHYRESVSHFYEEDIKHQISITRLKIDFEYILFLLKKYSNFCEK